MEKSADPACGCFKPGLGLDGLALGGFLGGTLGSDFLFYFLGGAGKSHALVQIRVFGVTGGSDISSRCHAVLCFGGSLWLQKRCKTHVFSDLGLQNRCKTQLF